MTFLTLDYQQVRDQILRDIVNQPSDDGQPRNVSPDSDYAIRANATGAAIEGLYQRQQWIIRQLFPDSSDPDYLAKHAGMRGLKKKAATVATGTILFNGTPGSPVPIGTEAKTTGGAVFKTTAADVIGAGGSVSIAAQATVPGSNGNQVPGTSVALTSAPSGILSSASIGSMTGGTDIETEASLLSRLLFLLRNPPCGGATHDYYTWAMNVPGVTAAYVYRNRRGIGTVDVIILTAGGLPDAGLIATAQAYIDTQRPVQADFLVFGPTALIVNIAGSLELYSGYVLASVLDSISTRLAAYFSSLKPGDMVYLNRIRAIISDTPGIVDYTLTEPAGNVATLVDSTHTQMAVLGTKTFS